jgi:uncharacterized protein YrzB (UPF0473 family)
MENEFGSDFITVTDGEGRRHELEHLDTIELGDQVYMAFLPAGMDEEDADYGMVLLKVVEEDGEESFVTIDDDAEKEAVYEKFMTQLFSEENEE